MEKLLTDGVAIAAASAYVYLAAFMWEMGYCAHFSIPPDLIRLTVVNLLLFGAAMVLFILTLSQALQVLAPAIARATNRHHPYRILFALFVGLAIATIAIVYAYGLSRIAAILLLYIAFLVITPYVGIAFDKGALSDRMARVIQYQSSFDFLSFLSKGNPSWPIRTIFFAVAFLGICWIFGNGEASKKKEFMVFKRDPALVLVRNYGDLYIATRFDRATREVIGEMALVRFPDDGSRLEFKYEAVGPLIKANAADDSVESPVDANTQKAQLSIPGI